WNDRHARKPGVAEEVSEELGAGLPANAIDRDARLPQERSQPRKVTIVVSFEVVPDAIQVGPHGPATPSSRPRCSARVRSSSSSRGKAIYLWIRPESNTRASYDRPPRPPRPPCGPSDRVMPFGRLCFQGGTQTPPKRLWAVDRRPR